MARYLNPKPAQLLDQPPELRPAGGNLLSDLGTAHHHSSVFHQQPHDAPKPNVSRSMGGIISRGRACLGRSRTLACTSCSRFLNAGIMRERERNHKRRSQSLQAGTTRMLMSAACGECVIRPTEMKSTPVSA